jgi:hypothetical protein
MCLRALHRECGQILAGKETVWPSAHQVLRICEQTPATEARMRGTALLPVVATPGFRPIPVVWRSFGSLEASLGRVENLRSRLDGTVDQGRGQADRENRDDREKCGCTSKARAELSSNLSEENVAATGFGVWRRPSRASLVGSSPCTPQRV